MPSDLTLSIGASQQSTFNGARPCGLRIRFTTHAVFHRFVSHFGGGITAVARPESLDLPMNTLFVTRPFIW